MNKTSIAILTFLLIGIVAYFSTGCKKDAPAETEYTIKIDSVQHTDTINVGDVFDVSFFGKIGDNDCYEFLRFEPTFGVNLIEIKGIGKHTARDDCKGGEQYLSAGVGFTDLTAGDWTLKVLQPDGTTPLESTVNVK